MNLTNKILSYLKITRPINVLITFFVVVVAILISQKEQTDLYTILLASIAASLVAAAGNIVNDIYDIESDKISHPKRPLVLSEISIKEAWYLYISLSFISIFIAASLKPILLVIVIISTILLFIYSAYLKKLPLIGNITVAFLTWLAFIYGGYVTGNPGAAIVPAGFAFLINLIREIVKDIQDVEGDKKAGESTFPIKYGFQKSKFLIVISAIILILYTFYPFMTQLYKIEYFIVVMVFVNPLLVLTLKILYDSKNENNLSVVSNMLKLNMVLGLIAIYLGK
ncbi:MAG: geranylgeranylglycerol-phosphate geranylgeranyltransferase [Ignavibacterium sp.]|nr:geranylgeranylglycerol-phosphate geranylgeranyltransferase [Ignavibacterium sp.]